MLVAIIVNNMAAAVNERTPLMLRKPTHLTYFLGRKFHGLILLPLFPN